MNPLSELVELKRQEKALTERIKHAQQRAIEHVLPLGKIGSLGVFNQAKVILKFVTVKPKPTDEVVMLQAQLDKIREALLLVNRERIEQLESELQSLKNNAETAKLQAEIDAQMALLAGEKKPQIQVIL